MHIQKQCISEARAPDHARLSQGDQTYHAFPSGWRQSSTQLGSLSRNYSLCCRVRSMQPPRTYPNFYPKLRSRSLVVDYAARKLRGEAAIEPAILIRYDVAIATLSTIKRAKVQKLTWPARFSHNVHSTSVVRHLRKTRFDNPSQT